MPILSMEYCHMDPKESFQLYSPVRSLESSFRSFLSNGEDHLFTIKLNQVTQMKIQNRNHPYIVKKLSEGGSGGGGMSDDDSLWDDGSYTSSSSSNSNSAIQSNVIVIGLTYMTAQELIQKVKPIFQLWTPTFNSKSNSFVKQSKLQIIDRIKKEYQNYQNQFTFDVTWLEDFREQQVYETNGVRVTPLVDTPGRIMLTTARIYFQPFNNISSKPVKKYDLRDVVRVMKRRHVLRHTGIEIYMKSGECIFFSFRSAIERDEIFLKMLQQPVLNSISADDLNNMTLKWQSGLISNFDYLMYLNFIADRSFNDLTQYPVFPWVIADYTSSVLKLDGDETNTFRDLSKPIGALNDKRLRRFQERYREMPDPKFLYGTHYSTPGYVLYFLIREAPEYMLRLQSGKFDAPDRIFNGIAQSWNGVFENDADLKELIPEFYQGTGEFLVNTQQLDLGVKHNGQRVNHVSLPAWADNEKDFIFKNRLALESSYVSDNLHHWIDLIFGYKQRGVEAANADNLFYYLTYEGAVDIDKIHDPMERSSIEMQIREFGQTPKQIFTRPHPKRRAGTDMSQINLSSVTDDNIIQMHSIQTAQNDLSTDFSEPIKTEKSHTRTWSDDIFNSTLESIGLNSKISSRPSTPVSSSLGRAPAKNNTAADDDEMSIDDLLVTNFSRKSSFRTPTSTSRAESTPVSPTSPLSGRRLRLQNVANSRISSPQAEVVNDSGPKFKKLDQYRQFITAKLHRETIGGIVISPIDNRVYTASHDASVKIYSTDSQRQLRRIADMGDMALSSLVSMPSNLTGESRVLIVSSWDNNVYAYSVDYGRILDTIHGHEDAVSKISISGDVFMSSSWDSSVKFWKCIPSGFSKVPIMDFSEHQSPIHTCCMDNSGTMAVSGAEDGDITVYDLRQKKQVCSFTGHMDSITDVCFLGNDSRRIVSCSKDQTIKLFEINGAESFSYAPKEIVRCIASDGDMLYSGGDSGVLKMWNARDGSLVDTKDSHPGSSITCISFSGDLQSMATGAKDGSLSFYR